MTATRLSGLQKSVLALYRSMLREAVKKDRQALLENTTPNSNAPPPPSTSTWTSFTSLLQDKSTTLSYAHFEFRRQVGQVKRSDFRKIEYMIRKGEKQLKLLKMPGTKVVKGTSLI